MSGADTSDEDMPISGLRTAPSAATTSQTDVGSDSQTLPRLSTAPAKPLASSLIVDDGEDSDDLIIEDAPPLRTAPTAGRRLRKGRDAPLAVPRAPKPACSDSEDELLGALPQKGTGPAAPLAPTTAPKPSTASDDSEPPSAPPSGSEDDASNLDSSDEEYVLAGTCGGRRSKSLARVRTKAGASDGDGSDSGSGSGPTLRVAGGAKRRRDSKAAADKPRPKSAKPQQRKRSILSESDSDSHPADARVVSAKGSVSQLIFSDEPKKEVDVRLLPNSAFLLVPSLAKRSEWKLPYKDVKGRVNVSLLHAARLAVRTKMINKKPLPFTVTPELERKVERLWREAKAWHRARRQQAAATVAAASKSVGRVHRSDNQKAEESNEEEILGAALQKATNPSTSKPRAGASPTASDSESEENDTLGSLLGKSSAASPVAAQPKEAEDAESAESENDAGEPAAEQGGGAEHEISFDDDEEAEYLAQYEQGRQRAQVKERFWRRDAFIADDDEDEEEGERSEDEALEEGERRGQLPLRVGRYNDEQMYDLLHSESQRLLRKQKGALPCRKEKALSLKSLISNIERRHAEARAEAAPAPAPEEEVEEPKTDRLLCLRCTKLLTAKDVPVFDGKAAAGIFCSSLCLRMHRLAPAPRSAADSQETQEAETSQVSHVGCASDDDDEPLVVLPSGATPKADRSRIKLERLVKHECAVSLQARGSLLRKLRGEASGIRKEEARLSGKYVEESQSSTDWFQAPFEEEDGAEDEEALGVDEELDDEVAETEGPSSDAQDAHEAEASAYEATNSREETSEPADEQRADEESLADAAGKDATCSDGDSTDSAQMYRPAEERSATEEIVDSAPSAPEAAGVANANASRCGEQHESEPSVSSTTPAPSTTEAAREEPNSGVEPTSAAVANLESRPVAVPAPAAASAPAPTPVASAVGLTSMFGRTFARRPQQSKLQFSTVPRPKAERETPVARVDIPAPVEDVLEAMQKQEDEEDATQQSHAERAPQSGAVDGIEHEGEAEQPRKRRKPALVDDEAVESGEEEAGEGEEADASVDSEAGGDSDELVDEDVETSHGAMLAEQARRAVADDQDEVEAILRGLERKRRRGRSVEEELLGDVGGGDDGDEGAGKTKAARRSVRQPEAGDEDAAEDASDDDLRSLNDFIADDESEAEVELEPEAEVEEEGEEAEDESAKIIRAKLGGDWVVGDRSAPAIICDDEGDKKRAAAIRESLKRRREMEVQLKRNLSEQNNLENEPSSAGSTWVVPGDDKSTTIWQLLSESQSSSAGYAAKKPERQSSGPKPAQMTKTFAATATVNPASAPPMLRKFGSFNDKRGSDHAQRLGQGPATSFSKAFVFRDDSSSHATHGDVAAGNASGVGKGWQAAYDSSRGGNVQRRPLGRVPNANAPAEQARGASLLAKVLGGSKNWAAAKRT